MYAREGLRDLVKELPQGNNLRRHLSNLYNEMTDEVATKNPAWKAANDLYRDGAAADEAIALGKQLATRQGAPSREALSALAVADRESAQASKAFNQAKKAYAKAGQRPTGVTADEQAAFELAKARFDAIDARQSLMRTAYAQNLTDAIANQGETHDLVRKMLLPGSKNIIGRVLGDKADPFIKTLQAEAAIHRTYKSQFGSQTTPLALHEAELNWAPRFEASMANPLTWGAPLMRLAQEYAARNINAKRNTDLMRLYTETDPLKQLESLRAMQQLHAARTTAGNAVGKPAIGLGSGVLPEALIATEQGQLYQPIKPYRPATP
jgi:hypothetical protein